jgi:hypothetical protein
VSESAGLLLSAMVVVVLLLLAMVMVVLLLLAMVMVVLLLLAMVVVVLLLYEQMSSRNTWLTQLQHHCHRVRR